MLTTDQRRYLMFQVRSIEMQVLKKCELNNRDGIRHDRQDDVNMKVADLQLLKEKLRATDDELTQSERVLAYKACGAKLREYEPIATNPGKNQATYSAKCEQLASIMTILKGN